MNNEPEEIAEARRLFEEFEKSEGLSKKHFFEEAITLLREFLTENPDSEFSKRASNLINIYTKKLIVKLGTTPFSNFGYWATTLLWVLLDYSKEIEKVITDNPELKDSYNKFTKQQTWSIDELIRLLEQC
jgi:hypothetical protein